MQKTAKILIGIALAIGLAIGGYMASGSFKQAEQEEVVVGAILPLSGDLAVLGEEVKRGVELAAEDMKNEGISATVVYEDDRFDPSASVSAANKLISIDKVDVAMTMFVEEAKPMASVFNTSKTPLLVLWDNNAFIKVNEYLFSNGFSTEKAGEDMAEYAYNRLHMKTVATIGHKDPWAEIIAKAFNEKFEALGGKVIYNEAFNVDVTDYKTAIAQIKQVNPDGVYFPLVPMNNARFIVQAKQLGLDKTLLTGDALIQDVVTETGGASEGIYFTNIYSENTGALIAKYRAKYGVEPEDVTLVAFGYDGLMQIKDAAKREGNTKKEIVAGLRSIMGESRAAKKMEKIYTVVNGSPEEIN